jgi:hypothetical protein
VTTIDDPREQVLRVCQTATAWLHVLGACEADAMVDHILNYTIATLRRDQRMPQLPLAAWNLLLADTRARATEKLVELIAGKADLGVAVDCITDAILASRIMLEPAPCISTPSSIFSTERSRS